MACLKWLLPAGYSGCSQIPAQSGSHCPLRWAEPCLRQALSCASSLTLLSCVWLHLKSGCVHLLNADTAFSPSAWPGWDRHGQPSTHQGWMALPAAQIPATTTAAQNRGRLCPHLPPALPRLGLGSSTGEISSLKGHCLNQHLNDIPNLFLKFINPFVFSSSKTLSQDIM